MNERIILGIETSCDDTSICILKENRDGLPEILIHKSFSQELILKKWGGVVPEIAARNHLDKIVPLLDECFKTTKLCVNRIDLIGVTTHPGLLGPLLTGINAAKTLSLFFKKSIVPINHLYSHLEAIHLSDHITYPYIGLLVSGGHSIYFLVTDAESFEVLGSTTDDAAGEAFDKGAKLLDLGYPGGKIIDDLAQKGDSSFYPFPIGLKNSNDCNLSYSGLKTSLRDMIEKNKINNLENICASYQHAIVEALRLKMTFAIKKAHDKFPDKALPIVVGGGVAANSYLRKVFTEHFPQVHFVDPSFCTDNGAMVANYALRINHKAISFPDCLGIDALGKFIDKEEIRRALGKQ
jgi:N6-L-threonylcarbamoyladenine synthase